LTYEGPYSFAELGASLAIVARNKKKVQAAAEMTERYGAEMIAKAVNVNDSSAVDIAI